MNAHPKQIALKFTRRENLQIVIIDENDSIIKTRPGQFSSGRNIDKNWLDICTYALDNEAFCPRRRDGLQYINA